MTTSFNLVISALFLVLLVKSLLDIGYPDYICSINKFNLFTLQWKPQLCYENPTHPNCWNNDIPNITIHGIWQNYYTESYPTVPEFCTDAKLFDEHVEGITEQLDIMWPSYRKDTNFKFWEHEWDKHGTCWNVVNQSEYFQTGLKWIAQYDIENVLADNHIYPSICEYDNVIQDIICKQEYPLHDVSNALDKVMNLRSVVWCTDKKYINEFIMCRDWNGAPINCPDSIVTDCGDMVVLRSFIYPRYSDTDHMAQNYCINNIF